MITFYFTFGQSHRHPVTNERLKDYWVEIHAHNLEIAEMKMKKKYGFVWSNVYTVKEFQKHWFPKGCYEVII